MTKQEILKALEESAGEIWAEHRWDLKRAKLPELKAVWKMFGLLFAIPCDEHRAVAVAFLGKVSIAMGSEKALIRLKLSGKTKR